MYTITGTVVATTKEKDGSMRVCLQHDGYAQIYRISKASSLQFVIDAPEYKQRAHKFSYKAGRLLRLVYEPMTDDELLINLSDADLSKLTDAEKDEMDK